MAIILTSGSEAATFATTEILSLDTMTWTSGPQFPTGETTYKGTSLSYGNSFLAIGGYTYETKYRDDIWYFNHESYKWELMSKLETGREQLTAIGLPENICNLD